MNDLLSVNPTGPTFSQLFQSFWDFDSFHMGLADAMVIILLVFFTESMLLHLAVFNTAFSLQDCDSTEKTPFTELFLSTFAQIHDWRECHESLFLFDSIVSAQKRTVVFFNIEVMRFFTLTIAKHPTVLDSSQWDTILCSTVSWMQSIAETRRHLLDDVLVLAFTSAASELLQAVAVCLQSVIGSENLGYVPPNLLLEWKDLFCPSAYGILMPLFFEVSEKLAQSNITPEVNKRSVFYRWYHFVILHAIFSSV